MFGSKSSVECYTQQYDTGYQANEFDVTITTAEDVAMFCERLNEAVLIAKGHAF